MVAAESDRYTTLIIEINFRLGESSTIAIQMFKVYLREFTSESYNTATIVRESVG